MQDAIGLNGGRRAAIALLALGVYLEAVEWLDLSPWTTDVSVTHGVNGQATLDLAMGGIIIVLAAWLWRGGWIPALVATAFLTLWGWLQIASWWIPYFQGASSTWKAVYARWFANTVQILPSSPGHLPPDANHFVLQLLILMALILAVYESFSGFERKQAV